MRVPGVFATSFEPEGTPVGTAVVVPGRGYPPAAPLTFFAGFVLLQHWWSVRQVWGAPPPHESDEQTLAWVRGEVEAAVPPDGRVLVVAKSLGTLAAPLAAERGVPAAWLTPILGLPDGAGAGSPRSRARRPSPRRSPPTRPRSFWWAARPTTSGTAPPYAGSRARAATCS